MLSQKLITALNDLDSDSIKFIDIGCHQGAFITNMKPCINKPMYSIGIDAIDHGVGHIYDVFVNKAIDNVPVGTTKMFHLYNETGCNSLLELNKDILTQDQSEYDQKWYVGSRDIDWHYSKQDSIEVSVNSMQNILQELNFNQNIDFVKIDTQGNDVSVLLSFGTFLPSIKYIQIETAFIQNKDITLYKNQSIFEDDDAIIKSLGFELIDMLNWGINRDQCPEADLIYYNTKYKHNANT